MTLTSKPPLRAWRLERHRITPGTAVAAMFVVFLGVHLSRLALDQSYLNNSGGYLTTAAEVATGHIPRSHYSPGFGFLLAPIAWATGSKYHLLYLSASFLNVVVAGCALALLHLWFRRITSAWSAVGLTAVVALGETATNSLFAVEVEPVVLLLVVATLLALDHDRPWTAVVTTTLGALTRVAVLPFFGVLWLFQLRRSTRPAACALVGCVGGGMAYIAVQSPLDETYIRIASTSLGSRTGGHGGLPFVPSQAFLYLKTAIAAELLPTAVLKIPFVGPALGLLTVALIAFGAWRLIRAPALTAATCAGVTYLALLLIWPATLPDAIRLVIPMAPVVVLAATRGLCEGARWLPTSWRSRAVVAAIGGAIVLGSVISLYLGATVRTTDPRFTAFLALNRRVTRELPPGPVLSRVHVVEIVTGHPSFSFSTNVPVATFRARVSQVRACSVEFDPFHVQGASVLMSGVLSGGGVLLAQDEGTAIMALNEPWCIPARSA